MLGREYTLSRGHYKIPSERRDEGASNSLRIVDPRVVRVTQFQVRLLFWYAQMGSQNSALSSYSACRRAAPPSYLLVS